MPEKTAFEKLSDFTKKELIQKLVGKFCPDEFGWEGKYTSLQVCDAEKDCLECWTELGGKENEG